jgi:DNA polymerase-3 subunit gamma/tau
MIVRREHKFKTNNLLDLYRPCLPDEIVGQKTSKQIIKNGLDKNSLFHTILLAGPSGCGKTTAARIIALGLNCESVDKPTSQPCLKCKSCTEILNDSSMDLIEINVGKERGKAEVEHVIKNLTFAPMRLRYKVLIFDEAHQLTSAARDLLLKPIEDGFSHVYYIFCTNQPDKLIKSDKEGGTPFVDRCAMLPFTTVSYNEIRSLIENICVFEGVDFNKDIINIITEESHGVPRKAVNWLSQVLTEGSWTKEALQDIIGGLVVEDTNIFNICVYLNKGSFKAALQFYEKAKEKSNAESIRIMIAFYFMGLLKKHGDKKYSDILDVIRTPIYEQGKVADIAIVHYLYKIVEIINNGA